VERKEGRRKEDGKKKTTLARAQGPRKEGDGKKKTTLARAQGPLGNKRP